MEEDKEREVKTTITCITGKGGGHASQFGQSDKHHPPFFFQAVEFARLRRNERMIKQSYKGLAKG